MTYRNRSRWGLGLLALMLLTFGLAGCGGDEPAAVAPPPAPPPAPAPFVPQAVEVPLGMSGETVTLMTTEAGGYTLNGEAVATGAIHMAANGNTYTLTLDGTTRSAAYTAPEPQVVELGAHGGTIALTQAEDKSWLLGEMAITDGYVHTSENGNMYTVTLGEDGNWMASFVVPDAVKVQLGETGGALSLIMTEAGGYTLNGEPFASGTPHTSENGNIYIVTVGEDGTWMADYVMPPALEIPLGKSGTFVDVVKNENGTFSVMKDGMYEVITAETTVTADNGNVYRALQTPDGVPYGVVHVPAMQEVMLGMLEETVTLTQAEDQTWMIDGTTVMSGYVHTAANGNMYALALGEGGTWSAMYQAYEADVTLGTEGGTITLTRAEDTTWWYGEDSFMSGGTITANNNMYTLTLGEDGMWSAMYQAYEADVTLGTSGDTITLVRAEDMTWWYGADLFTSGGTIPAENGNTYTLTQDEEGMWSAMYDEVKVSVTLGTSGQSIMLTRAEDMTWSFSTGMEAKAGSTYEVDGDEYVLSYSDAGWAATYVSAMASVTLGELGGEVTLTRLEDGTWLLGDAKVATGYVHTTEDGNMYALTMDAEGMWSAMFQPVYRTVTLGTQGSIELKQIEDMSWWHGMDPVDVGSEVKADNDNTYTLSYADGVWSASFKPESMMIEGTGLVAMTREADAQYDVEGANKPIPGNGVGDITINGDAMYHVWMQDGALAGARFDKAIDAGAHTDRKVGSIGLPEFSANDPDTPGNELRTHIILTANADDEDAGKGMFSFGDLLGSGMASDQGARYVDEAVKAIEKVRADVSALLALDTKPGNLEGPTGILEGQWSKVEAALDDIFGTTSAADTATSVVRTSHPRPEDILDDIDDILDALASEDAFVAATAEDGGGVFARTAGGHGVLATGAAGDAFDRLTWSADATLGATGSTRYGTAVRMNSANAKSKPKMGQYGAFSYSTMQETVRTADAAAVSLTGIASYSGGTRAVSGSGKAYSGTMELQVRFKANTVSGVVSGLEDSDGLPWQHNFADVDRIVLDDGTLRRNAQWTHAATAGSNASVFYAANSGLLRPVNGVTNTFDGILLGQGDDAGSEANGTWSVGTADSTGYLAGGFGVVHVADTARPVPTEDDGSAATATLFSMATDANAGVNMTSASIADGMLTVKQRSYGWRDHDADGTVDYGWLAESYNADTPDGTDDTNPTLLTAKFDLTALKDKGAGATTTVNGPKWVDQVVSILENERDLLSTLQGLKSDDTEEAEEMAWQRVQNALQYQMLGNLPIKMDDDYGDLESEADAIDLINRALDALSSNANLEAALDPDGTGIFDHYWTDTNSDGIVDDDEINNFVNAAKEKVNGRTFAQMRGERAYKVIATLGTTSYTRFGAWRRESTANSARMSGGVIRNHGGPGTFAYSALDPTNVGTPTNPGFPRGGRASYTGETVAIQNTTTLTGTVLVDVSWSSLADTDNGLNADGDAIAIAGTMSLTISDLASAAGDPLTFGGTPKSNDLDANPTAVGSAGTEIADIVLGTFNIVAGAAGNNSGHLIVGTSTAVVPATTPETFTYSEIAPTVEGGTGSTRLRFAGVGVQDNVLDSLAASTAKALFVGQGVDGPLGAIGTYTIATGAAVTPGNVTTTISTSIGRLGGNGLQSVDVGSSIYGAFGAEAP